MWPVTSKNLMCSESIVINCTRYEQTARVGNKEERTDLVDTKNSEIDDRRLVLFKPLQEDIVDISTPLICKPTNDEVDVSW